MAFKFLPIFCIVLATVTAYVIDFEDTDEMNGRL